jgi:tripartite-type tricarboxylate transporter receptor subunit TctC
MRRDVSTHLEDELAPEMARLAQSMGGGGLRQAIELDLGRADRALELLAVDLGQNKDCDTVYENLNRAAILDVNPKFPASNVKEFIAYAKSKPNGVTIATPGRGSVGEIVNGMTRGILDIPVTNVPYRGGAPAVTDVLKGVVDAYYDAISSSLPLYHGGSLKSLAITGRKRSPGAPDVPTLAELGYKDFILENLYTVLARKGTPRPIIDKLNGYLRRAMDEPDFKQVLLSQGVVPEPSSPEEAKAAIQEDYEMNARMVKRFNIPPVQ